MKRPTLGDHLKHQDLTERQTALVRLLTRPLLLAESSNPLDAQAFTYAQRHETELRRFLTDGPGWTLRIQPRSARLFKSRPTPAPGRSSESPAIGPFASQPENDVSQSDTPSPADLTQPPRPALDPTSSRPFTRRRYALLLLVLTVLDYAETQTTVGQIAEKLGPVIAHDPALENSGLTLDLSEKTDREDLVHALRLLIHLGVLQRIDGDEGRFVSSRQGDALYNINTDAANTLIAPRRAPSQISVTGFNERYAAIAFDTPPSLEEGDTARNRRVRQNLYRRLLDDPVVYFADLPDDEREYFTGQRPRILKTIEAATGLPAEVRAEGVALLDLTGRATDARLPEEGTDGHVCLLTAEYLAQAVQRGEHTVSRAQLHERAAGWIAEYGRAHWRKDACAPGAEAGLIDDALNRLYGLGLIDLAGPQSDITPRPAIARYRLEHIRNGSKI